MAYQNLKDHRNNLVQSPHFTVIKIEEHEEM